MTTSALVLLVLSVTLVWGGLVASVLRLRHDTRTEDAADRIHPEQDAGHASGD